MRIKSLEIDGYGVWSKLKLDGLGEGLHVFYGPNEAGKTTLMQFLRSMFFGFSPDRRRYLPPVHGGRPGGAVDLVTSDGAFRLSRHDDGQTPGPRGTAVLAASDGTRHGETYVQSLLAGTDEATFNNVFSVGLREIQELGTLGGTEAASLLFRLTAGMDRVSLVDVIRELNTSRRRLLSDDGRQGQIPDLLERRDELRRGVEELDSLTAQYGQLMSQRAELDRDAERLDETRGQLEHDARVLETAVSLRDRWARRGQIDLRLAGLNISTAGLQEAIARFEHWDARLSRVRKHLARLARRRQKILRRAAAIEINEPLQRQAARIEAFREQEGWIASLRAKVAQLETEARTLDEESRLRREQLGLSAMAGEHLSEKLGGRTSRELRRLGRLVRSRREALAEARSRLEQLAEAASQEAAKLDSALAARGVKDLDEAIRAAGELASQLRRSEALDSRIEQLQWNEEELEDQSRELLDRQVLPLPVVLGLGGVFMFFAILVVAGVIVPTGWLGAVRWLFAILGVSGLVATFVVKIVLERSNYRKLDVCQQRIHMLQTQLAQATDERAAIERSLPSGGSREVQLAAAEKDLAELQPLLPLGARRQGTEHETETARRRVEQAEREFRSARRQWNDALARSGLPERISPKQLRAILSHRRQWAVLARRSAEVASELRARQAEYDALRDRVVELATQAGAAVRGVNPIDLLRELGDSLRQEQARVEERNALLASARRLRRKRMKLAPRVRALRLRRRRALRRLGVRDGDELRLRRESLAEASELQRQRQTLQTEIEAALAGQCSEVELAACLAGGTDTDLESRWDAIGRQLDAIRAQIEACLERRGQIKAQLAELAEDRRPGRKRLELGMVEERLAAAAGRWRTVALTGRMLAAVKEFYETQRQPETLQEASEYLRRLTGGRYTRVWTPLGEDVLRVDGSDGETLGVEVLSEGTREQLFLSLRLALVACYGRRGVRLPLVLDDVLVNFDAPRAKAAASLLRDFARGGHQLLVFTCHDHLMSLFKSLGVDVCLLPSHRDTAAGKTSVAVAPRTARPKKHGKRKQRKHVKRVPQFRLEEEMAAWSEEDLHEPADSDEEVDDEETSWGEAADEGPEEEQEQEDDEPVDSEDEGGNEEDVEEAA